MKLYYWDNFTIANKNYTIFSLAENEEQAKSLALQNIKNKDANLFASKIISKNKPRVLDTPVSFIWGIDGQLSI